MGSAASEQAWALPLQQTMSGPAKKAATAAAKTVARQGIPLTSARAVTQAEAPRVTPNATSTTETMMPWNGWFSSFLKDRLGAERYDKLKGLVLYRPDDIHSLHQIPNPSTKVPISKDDPTQTAMFRYPSPGSQPPVRMPEVEEGEDPYDISYYKRDTGRRNLDPAFPNPELEKMKLDLLPQDDPRVQEMQAQFEEGPKSSPGNKGRFATGQTNYDPKGLRASMSTSNEALEESLDSYMPDHLPTPDWWDKQDEIVAWYEERDLPVPIGGVGHGLVPREGRIARW